MNCEAYRDWISLLADRRLDPADAGRLSDHLAGCPDCRRHQEHLESADALLRRYPETTLPEDFEDRVLAAVRGEPAPRPRARLAPILAVAAAAALAAGLFHFATRNRVDMQAAVASHADRVAPLAAAVEAPTVGAPEVELAVAMEGVRLLDLKDRTQAVLSLPLETAKNGRELRTYALSAERFVNAIEQGQLFEARRQAVSLRQAAQVVRGTLYDAAPVTVSAPSTATATAQIALGRLALASGNYDLAVRTLTVEAEKAPDLVQRTAAAVWLSDAYRNAGQTEKALFTLVSCRPQEVAFVPRLRALGERVYVNGEPLAGAPETQMVTWAATPQTTYAVRLEKDPMTWCLIAPSKAPLITTLEGHARDLDLRFERSEPYTAVWLQPQRAAAVLQPDEWKELRTHLVVDAPVRR